MISKKYRRIRWIAIVSLGLPLVAAAAIGWNSILSKLFLGPPWLEKANAWNGQILIDFPAGIGNAGDISKSRERANHE